MYDIEKIKHDLDPVKIVKYFGAPIKMIGGNSSIRCPLHEEMTGHEDKHFGNCFVTHKFRYAFKCFSCQASGDGFMLIAAYANLNVRTDFYKILEIAVQICGDPDSYILEDDEDFDDYNSDDDNKDQKNSENKDDVKKKRIFTIDYNTKNPNGMQKLSQEDLELIGIQPFSSAYKVREYLDPSYLKYFDETDAADLKRDPIYNKNDFEHCMIPFYMDVEDCELSLKVMERENPDFYKQFILDKAKKACEYYKYMAQEWRIPLSSDEEIAFFSNVKHYFKKRFLQALNIYILFDDSDSAPSSDWLNE